MHKCISFFTKKLILHERLSFEHLMARLTLFFKKAAEIDSSYALDAIPSFIGELRNLTKHAKLNFTTYYSANSPFSAEKMV